MQQSFMFNNNFITVKYESFEGIKDVICICTKGDFNLITQTILFKDKFFSPEEGVITFYKNNFMLDTTTTRKTSDGGLRKYPG